MPVGQPHPIDSWGDIRLNGSFISGKFFDVYNDWVDALVSNPVIQKGKLERGLEYGRRSFNALIAIIGMVVASPLLLIAKICQIVHFYSLSKEHRAKPPAVKVDGHELPELDTLTAEEANETVLEHNLNLRLASSDSALRISHIDQLNQDIGPLSESSCLSVARGCPPLKDSDPPLYHVFFRTRDTISMSKAACFKEKMKELQKRGIDHSIAAALAKQNGYRVFKCSDSSVMSTHGFDSLFTKVTGPQGVLWQRPIPPGAPAISDPTFFAAKQKLMKFCLENDLFSFEYGDLFEDGSISAVSPERRDGFVVFLAEKDQDFQRCVDGKRLESLKILKRIHLPKRELQKMHSAKLSDAIPVKDVHHIVTDFCLPSPKEEPQEEPGDRVLII